MAQACWSFIIAVALALNGCVATGASQPGEPAGFSAGEDRWTALLTDARAQGRRCGNDHHAAAAPLVWDPRLGEAAASHSRDMARTRRLGHVGSGGETLADRLRAAGYRPRAWGENVATGQPDPAGVVRAWLGSPGHCANIMNSAYTQFGAAVAQDRDGVRYWTLVLGAPAD